VRSIDCGVIVVRCLCVGSISSSLAFGVFWVDLLFGCFKSVGLRAELFPFLTWFPVCTTSPPVVCHINLFPRFWWADRFCFEIKISV